MHNTALILDDEPFMLELLRCMLEELGVPILQTLTSANAALKLLEEHPQLGIVICDLNMPGMDGVEFLRNLSQRKFAGNVILLSGEDQRTLKMVEILGEALELRILGTLKKPVEKQVLEAILKRHHQRNPVYPIQPMILSERELQQGLAGNAVIALFQPQVEIQSRRVVGVEALARWTHPERGLLSPAVFIPLAEASGQIHLVTDSIIRQVVRLWKTWHEAGLDLCVSVNVTMSCLSRIEFPDWLVAQTSAVEMPLDRLTLEITEGSLMQDSVKALDVLSRLCLKRVRLSIDDFGTAYSNLEKLKLLPFAELKIDRSFVHDAAVNSSTRRILESSAALGKGFAMQVIAEGVENQEDWDCAAAAGCHLIQGFHVARPMPAEQLLVWMNQWHQPTNKDALCLPSCC